MSWLRRRGDHGVTHPRDRPPRAVERVDGRPGLRAPRRAHPVRIGGAAGRRGGGAPRPAADHRPRRPRVQVPPQPAGLLAGRQELLPPVLGHRGSRAARGLPHRPDRDRGRPARRARDQAAAVQPDAARRRGGRLPRHAGHPAHPSVPWQDEAISIATHKANVYIDLSGWSPKYFPPQLVRAASSLLQDKVLFGTDYPLLTPERWLRDFELLEVKPEVRPKILKHNAARLLGLA